MPLSQSSSQGTSKFLGLNGFAYGTINQREKKKEKRKENWDNIFFGKEEENKRAKRKQNDVK